MAPRVLAFGIESFDLGGMGVDFAGAGTTLMVLEPGLSLGC